MDVSELFTSISERIIQRSYAQDDEMEIDFFDIMNETYEDYYGQEKDEEDAEDGFKSNEEIKEAFEQLSTNPETINNMSIKKIIQIRIVRIILWFIVDICIAPYLQENVGMPVMAYAVAQVKELPEKTSEFIGQLKGNEEAIVIDSVPYYYKVTFTDENGDEKEGFVSKRSVRLVKDAVETEETGEVEESETELQTDLEM